VKNIEHVKRLPVVRTSVVDIKKKTFSQTDLIVTISDDRQAKPMAAMFEGGLII